MTITSSRSADGRELTIQVKGRFDFSTHQDFRGAYERVPATALDTWIIDLRDATYLDSSALGMLLLLRDYAGGEGRHVRIVNCNPDVRKILTISNFEQLFSIQ